MAGIDFFTFLNGKYSSDYMEKNEIVRMDYTMNNTQVNYCIMGKGSPYNDGGFQQKTWYNSKATSNETRTMTELNTALFGTTNKRLAGYIRELSNTVESNIYQISLDKNRFVTLGNIMKPATEFFWGSCSPYDWVERGNNYSTSMLAGEFYVTNSNYIGAAPTFVYRELVDCNFPILETEEDWQDFVTAEEPDWSKVLNKPSDYSSLVPKFSDFYANANYNTIVNSVIGEDVIRFQKFRQRKPNSTYLFLDIFSENLNNLKLYVDSNYPVSRLYHNDGSGYIADSEIVYSEFPNTGQKEINQTIYNIIFRTNIPIFSDQSKADEYIRAVETKDDAEIEKALQGADNYDYITNKSNDYNPIGQEVDKVILNDGYSRQAFTTLLAMDYSALSEINNKVFDSQGSFIDAILNGLKLYGSNPIEAVISLNYLPFNISEVASTGSQKHVNFGSYVLELEHPVYNVQNARCVIDMGSVIFSEQTGSWLDFEPVTEMYIYLPYIGINKLDISKYYLKSVKLEYIVDLNTSACTAVLSGNNVILDYFDGNIGVNMPITGYNNGEYANTVLNATMQTIKGGVGALATAPTGKISADTLSSLGQFEGGMFALTQTINANHMYIKGNASSGVGMCQPQYPIIYIIKNETFEPENLHQLVGYPSSFGGKVKSCSGYLQCSDVKLTSTATDKEKEEIISHLKSGIYL